MTPPADPLAGWHVLVPQPPADALIPHPAPAPAPDEGDVAHASTARTVLESPVGAPRAVPGGAVPAGWGAASPAVVALGAVGAVPVVVPLVRTVPAQDPTPLDDALLALGAGWYEWLAVTSQAAVAVLAQRAAHADEPLAAIVRRGGAQVAAVGPGTRRALEALDVPVALVPPVRSTAADLVAAFPAPGTARAPEPPAGSAFTRGPWPAAPTPTTGRVLVPRGDLAAPTLTDGLAAAGWQVDDVVAYRTVPAEPPPPDVATAWADGTIRAVLLTSASSVRSLVDHLGPPPASTLVVVIGPSTAVQARRSGLRVDAVAREQSLAGLVTALVAVATPSEEHP
ncbi:uroporphyrinogen-III synthase [Cellulomonas sp. SLBN-39]|uniref:uroporphyrinogen-III synthase n=1 Tax=Cellulomonas sp. SLBN-39 TaxID=2768446 RepID=UPI001150BDB4|nr:uroporphyrinogen-III synthase [Cellulomonas sp. SLBN-39]TQL02433.1 uroporphyrinogen-III synthase [Cellulomonas sp. SLBN-39]